MLFEIASAAVWQPQQSNASKTGTTESQQRWYDFILTSDAVRD